MIRKRYWREGDVIAHFCTFSYSPFKNHYLAEAPQWVMSLTEADRTEFLRSYPDPDMWEAIGFMPHRVGEITQEATRVLYVESWWEVGQVTSRMHQSRVWFDSRYTFVEAREFDGIRVFIYEIKKP